MQIYHVQADVGHCCFTLGYATGDENVIKRYYDDRKGYALRVTPIQVINITDKAADERAKLVREKQDLEARLRQINKGLEK